MQPHGEHADDTLNVPMVDLNLGPYSCEAAVLRTSFEKRKKEGFMFFTFVRSEK